MPFLPQGTRRASNPAQLPGDQPEGIGPLEETAADRLRDFFGEQQQFLLVGVEGGSEAADQVFAGVVAEVEFAVLDLTDVGERDADPLAQRSLAKAVVVVCVLRGRCVLQNVVGR
jgi:hypothetical protein